MVSRPVPSAALVAANLRLHHLRQHLAKDTPIGAVSEVFVDPDVVQERPFLPQKIENLPDHLGWESHSASRLVRARKPQQMRRPLPVNLPQPSSNFSQINAKSAQCEAFCVDFSQSVKVYPDIALAMLRQEQAAAGRLWLILRHLDREGRGVLRVVNIKQILTTSKKRYRLCGWRQLRNLLRQGDGIFWQRDKEQVWLRSAGRVAAGLDVSKLNGRPVSVPIKHLLGTIGEARAYLYASFHAGRQAASEPGLRQKPIARDTLTTLTGLTAESQRGYERRIGIHVSQNYVVGERANQSSREERIWQQGGGTFEFVDYRGVQGKPGNGYVAWQLPNSYRVTLAHRPKGRQKRINRMLSDLFMQGMTGNKQRTIEKRYFGDGAGAAKAVGSRAAKRNCVEAEVFWLQHGGVNGRSRLWHMLTAVGG
ncbi:MAG: hypothetical protein IAF02_12535 [Anaerolineae bacterium]|nr:hypothetical protein [Anaerolineae bacterium]